ncbi:MAG: D-glycero-beta-D-manno-heptose 1-phosphate adenylyltransferase [Chitinophagaceae bacterium]|nr:D-glycero-beta-D-manno-heptose 1-phosphate adenylyltransferase [Chitinophagaceae bacterium]MCB9045096.1 D-glycero-beta-D-manno-heptose 1-phosphate adenylyltransferase [Chitinophagales bacterium]
MHKRQWIEDKITDLEVLQRRVNIWRSAGKKIVFTNGCFDILHRGHLELIADAADKGNVLIVGVNSDSSVKKLKGNDRPIYHEQDRLFQLASLLCVDAVCLFDEDTPENLIRTIRPDVLVKGGDYSIETIVGAEFVMSYGGRVEVIPFVAGYSTSSVITNIKKL